MKSSFPRRAGFVCVALVLLVGVIWWKRREKPAPADLISSGAVAVPTIADSARAGVADAGGPIHAPVSTSPSLPPAPPVPMIPVPHPGEVAASPEAQSIAPEQSRANEAATARMVMAHASLRFPEVADAESVANRRILHAMVTKALAHQAAQATTPSN